MRTLTISIEDIKRPGGNESPIPPKIAVILEPKGWREIRISGDLLIKFYPRKGRKKGVFSDKPSERKVLENYIDGHNIDFVKGRVAVDVEWNSKDQTFDRDLMAMRSYYESGIISMGVIITRGSELCSFPAKGPAVVFQNRRMQRESRFRTRVLRLVLPPHPVHPDMPGLHKYAYRSMPNLHLHDILQATIHLTRRS